MRKYLPPKCHATRIENRHGGGIPDVHICIPGVSFWVELKASKADVVSLRPQQAAWHARQASCGGLSYVLCGFAHPPYVKIWRASAPSQNASAGLLCGPALIESDSMADALRLLCADALRLNAAQSSAALRSAAGTEKTPDA
jgi:hypothetical protein